MRTKIVATLGPASFDKSIIDQMAQAGVNVFRLNFSHGDPKILRQVIQYIRELGPSYHHRLAILGDLQGPKIRIGEVENNAIHIQQGQRIQLAGGIGPSKEDLLWINYSQLTEDVKPGDQVLLDDGKISLKVKEKLSTGLLSAEVLVGGILTARKGVNLPDSHLTLSALSEKDLMDLRFAYLNQLDWIALSFVRSSEDILKLRENIQVLGRNWNPGIVAKIEKPEAVKNLDSIIEVSDALMVARGDLGVELPYEQVPAVQKLLIHKSIAQSKPVIVATQMLEGMINNTRPTRAEINDVANSVMDGADALMLSAETSMGQYPVEAVRAMRRIIDETEKIGEIHNRKPENSFTNPSRLISDAVIEAAIRLSEKTEAKAILTYTLTGYTAMRLASYRPKAQIFIFARSPRLIRRLSLVWGITGFVQQNLHYTDDNLDLMVQILLQNNAVNPNDIIVKITGFPMKEKAMSNMVVVTRVKNPKPED